VQPAEVELPEALVTTVGDFAWSLAYHHHPGFENNEGGGVVTLSFSGRKGQGLVDIQAKQAAIFHASKASRRW
jgi:hypothetical protein